MFMGSSSHEVRSAIISLISQSGAVSVSQSRQSRGDRETRRRLGTRHGVRVHRTNGHLILPGLR